MLEIVVFLFCSLVPPTITIDKNEFIGIMNKSITINCQADGYPLPLIYWTRAGRPIGNQPGKKMRRTMYNMGSYIKSHNDIVVILDGLIN